VVLLIGNLGAGKTMLAKGIVSGLGAAPPEEVSSPTFTLIHEYGEASGATPAASHAAPDPPSHAAPNPASHAAPNPAPQSVSHPATNPASHAASQPTLREAADTAHQMASHAPPYAASYAAADPAQHAAADPAYDTVPNRAPYTAQIRVSHAAPNPVPSQPSEPPRHTAPQGPPPRAARVYHIDLYRLEEARDAATLGLDEIFERDAIVLIEWGERFPQLMPAARTEIRLRDLGGDEREIEVTTLP
jgi:tRNA A37 threonylcarbamoyladenosine biosynthesis protein TsaE